MTRVLVLVAPGEAPLPGLDDLPTTVELRTVSSESDLRRHLPQTDVLVVTDFRTDLLERCWPDEHRIRWVHATSAGVDALMFPALRDSDVLLTNARGVFDLGIAEYVLGAVLMHAKDSLGNLALQRQQRWQHRETALVARQRALVIGAGSIGSEVARLLSALDIEVIGIARTARSAEHFSRVLASEQLDGALPEADIVVITAPLTDATRGLINRDRLARMRSNALLVNVGRGAIVVTDDLVAALQAGQLGGAVLDVVDPEPLPEGHPLWDLPNVMLSAHMAGDFIGWRRALGEQFMANLQRWLADEPLLNIVNRGK
ncbi:D-2-hydroxyacid dehydrogenase [Halopseudomonas aestusnigri]|jgi:phosphoglycerate dehydrogenase-like enzyme|uniref:D-2-hydroxyacid dehydrogenase n=1 Tax=Halopseudomonas TaxID=2901189 RepID=UPI000C8C5242|nr:D-2-hydroxyacid dehydrogenase [Halopseudomonas aestusnigri]MAK75494.1 hydroxyacid dehydrogenase [Pseudomonadales bacterium]HCP02951.1 D-2-hydroxyacid dehydrogenase [Pseudomonas sp.]MAP76615.1 hydroxyacid dehydrogenase [Pseudomonadales bacterium]MCC4259386.1 D-2-hydroxyacid dehydrogenase [Halopseudomonas aestusnigri]MCK5530776.1 D-2-hydroxyacid dehydrogenase [Halopseudomonas aestusnigri]|tara:strand:+ start:4929 stop:5876 length:948 start_codon:yes stop_codon:yes gene_type:complete